MIKKTMILVSVFVGLNFGFLNFSLAEHHEELGQAAEDLGKKAPTAQRAAKKKSLKKMKKQSRKQVRKTRNKARTKARKAKRKAIRKSKVKDLKKHRNEQGDQGMGAE